MLGRDSWLAVWAKSDRDGRGACVAWAPLYQHLDDAMSVAERLVDEWVSPLVLQRIARDLPDGVSGARLLSCWLAGVHGPDPF